MKITTLAAALLAAAAALPMAAPAMAQERPLGALEDAETLTAADFVARAAEASNFEIRSSEIVHNKVSPEVKEFADMLIADHTKAGETMKELATEAGLTLPAEGAMSAEQEEMISELAGLHPSNTNNRYLDIQVEAHKRAVALFESYIANGEDGAIKGFAEETLPKLEDHLARAEELQGSLDEIAGMDEDDMEE